MKKIADFIMNIAVHMPVILLFMVIFFMKTKEPPLYSLAILRFCIKEELLFRVLPFQFYDRTVFNSMVAGVLNGLAIQHFISSTSSFSFCMNIFFGCSYAMGRLRYSFVESIQFRYFFMTLLLKEDAL